MSNEQKDFEIEYDGYKKDVLADYIEQFGENCLDYTFVDYLLCRMYYGNVPAKELTK